MPAIHRESSWVSILLILGGIFGLAFGFALFSQRQALAALIFGADFLSGIPVTQTDFLKVLTVSVQSFIAMGTSVLAIISGVVITILQVTRQGNESPGRPSQRVNSHPS